MSKISRPAFSSLFSVLHFLSFNFCNPRSTIRNRHSILLYLLVSLLLLLGLGSNVALALSSEGSTTDPVFLSLDTPHQGSVGNLFSLSSYYYFKTNEAGGYMVGLTNAHSNFAFNVFSDHFTKLVDDFGCDSYTPTPNGDKACVYNLAANTDYYVTVTDWDFISDSFTITITDIKSEGSPGAPLPIVDGITRTGMVDAQSSSYYSFTPTASGAHTLAITNSKYYGSDLFNETPLQIDVYAGSDFNTGLLRSCFPAYGAVYCTVNGLTAGVPVYVKISERSGMGYDTVFSVTTSKGIGEGSAANPVALTVGSTHAGGVDPGSNEYYQGCENPSYSYYTFSTAAGAGGYTVTTDNAAPLRVDLYRSFSDASLGYCTSFQGAPWPCMFSNIDADSNYYLRVSNCNNAIVNYNIRVIKEGSEGSVNNPVALTLETPHAGAIGFYETSYFTFTTDRSGTYYIVLNENLSWSYGSTPDFMYGTGDSCSGTAVCIHHVNLDANKTYYLKVSNTGSTGIMQYTVKVAHGASEGSIANPVSLPVGTPYSGTVESWGRSYYTFTTRAAADYHITFDNPTDLWVFAMTNPDFNNDFLTTACSGPGTNIVCTLQNLAANTPYYIETEERAGVNAAYNVNFYVLDRLAGCGAGSECYNFENGTTAPFTLTSTVTKGNVRRSLWKIDTTNNAAIGGTKSLTSGSLVYNQTNPQSTCFEYTRAATANSVLFSFKIAADYFNTIEFSIDGVVQPDGTFYNWPLWRRVIFFPTPGRHTYKWCFNENYPYPETPDSAWVDDIEFR